MKSIALTPREIDDALHSRLNLLIRPLLKTPMEGGIPEKDVSGKWLWRDEITWETWPQSGAIACDFGSKGEELWVRERFYFNKGVINYCDEQNPNPEIKYEPSYKLTEFDSRLHLHVIESFPFRYQDALNRISFNPESGFVLLNESGPSSSKMAAEGAKRLLIREYDETFFKNAQKRSENPWVWALRITSTQVGEHKKTG